MIIYLCYGRPCVHLYYACYASSLSSITVYVMYEGTEALYKRWQKDWSNCMMACRPLPISDNLLDAYRPWSSKVGNYHKRLDSTHHSLTYIHTAYIHIHMSASVHILFTYCPHILYYSI